jgi:hypothetical protein
MRLIILACTLVCATGLASAEPKASYVEKFHENTTAALLICRIQLKTALLKLELGDQSGLDESAKCMRDRRAESKKSFSSALASLSKKPAAAKLLKEYYAVWLGAFNGMMPSSDERKISYEQRQTAAEAKADEAWNRFEIEADI